MIRLSVSDLETYRYWSDREDSTVEELIAQLRGVAAPTHEMRASRAFHKALEHCSVGDYHEMVWRDSDGDEWKFEFDIDGELFIPAIRELKAERGWRTTAGDVTLVGKVDSLHGITVRDYKLSERFEADRYTDSYQWRAYLALFNARRFIYDVFQCKYDNQNPYKVVIYDIHHFPLDAYPDMIADLDQAIEELASVVRQYVPEKIAA